MNDAEDMASIVLRYCESKSALLRNPLVQGSAELSLDALSWTLAQRHARKDGSKETRHPASERSESGDDRNGLTHVTERNRYSNCFEAKQDSEYDVCNTLARTSLWCSTCHDLQVPYRYQIPLFLSLWSAIFTSRYVIQPSSFPNISKYMAGG